MQEKPRYSRVSDILDLAVFMSSKIQGVTISEIAERYNVSRRTAERMRDSLTCIFPSIDEIETSDNQKHWGFTNYSISNLITFSPKEIVNLEQLQRRTTNKELQKELGKTVEKIKSLAKKNLNSIEDNIELFMETEGYAVRQMPQYKISLEVVGLIREALQKSKMVSGIYHEKKRLIEPLGLIYGEKIYLIAKEKGKGEGIYTYLLHKFGNLELTDKSFDKGDFNLQEYLQDLTQLCATASGHRFWSAPSVPPGIWRPDSRPPQRPGPGTDPESPQQAGCESRFPPPPRWPAGPR